MDEKLITENASPHEKEISDAQLLGTRYEELFSFIYDLRLAGYQISTPQFIAIQKLVITLGGNGERLGNLERLKTYLAPLICASPEEQTNFYHDFDQWLETHQPPSSLRGSHEDDFDGGEGRPEPPEPESSFRAWLKEPRNAALSLLAAGLIITAIFSSIYNRKTETFSGRITDSESKAAIANANIVFEEETYHSNKEGGFSFKHKKFSEARKLAINKEGYKALDTFVEPGKNQDEYSLIRIKGSLTPTATETQTNLITPPTIETTEVNPKYYYPILLAAVLPFVVYGLWLLWRWQRRKYLERWRTRNEPDFKNLALEKNSNFLYRSPNFRRIVQELRRHRRVPTDALDVFQTVENTVRGGGLFQPVFGTRQVSPEFLILIDRLSFRDQKSQLEDKILDSFKREGVFYDCFYFNGDPRLCLPQHGAQKGNPPRYFKLQELSAHYPDHRLLIFSDGAGMVNKFIDRPYSWTKFLSQWETRALLTPNSALTYHEWILEQEANLPVLPAHEKDLKTLAEIIRTGEVSKIKTYAENTNYPPTLLEESESWWMRHIRPQQVFLKDGEGEISGEILEEELEEAEQRIETLCFELRRYLGKDGYLLLCACAVYPELAGDLTFCLAHRFVPSGNREATLEALVCLPWFRHSLMPDWLREQLISCLTYEQEIAVRQTIEQILTNYLNDPRQGFVLKIATQEPTPPENFWQRWRRLKFLHDVIRTEPEDSLLKDYVFLKFISGGKLAVAVPRKLSRFLQSQIETRFAFLRRFYEICADFIQKISGLFKEFYYKNLRFDGIFNIKYTLSPLFVSALCIGIFFLLPISDLFVVVNLPPPETSTPTPTNSPNSTESPTVSDTVPDKTNSPDPSISPTESSTPASLPVRTVTIAPIDSPMPPKNIPVEVNIIDKYGGGGVGDGIFTITREGENEPFISQEITNTNPITLNLPAGKYKIRADAEGYQAEEKSFEIKPTDYRRSIKLVLGEPDPQTIEFAVNVKNADTNSSITIGKITFTGGGLTTALNVVLSEKTPSVQLPPGNYTMNTSAPGYITDTQNILVTEDVKTVNIVLEPSLIDQFPLTTDEDLQSRLNNAFRKLNNKGTAFQLLIEINGTNTSDSPAIESRLRTLVSKNFDSRRVRYAYGNLANVSTIKIFITRSGTLIPPATAN